MRQMDQHLKERLVGAAVLVTLGVLVIPTFLDGPPSDEPVRVGLELPAADPNRKSHTIRLDVPPERPATPGSGSIVRAEPPAEAPDDKAPAPAKVKPRTERAETTVPTVEAPRATEAPASEKKNSPPPPEPAPAPSTPGGWAVQVGSFSSEENAARLSKQLRNGGYEVFVSTVVAGGKTMHRVRVGPVPAKDDAQILADRLKAGGHAGRVVANDG